MHRKCRRLRGSFLSVLVCWIAFAPQLLFAQAGSGAQSLLFDPSIRASGMGRASNAVFWGGDANHWANPALLGYQRGVRYEWGKTQLVPDLADDVFYRTKRLTLGYHGVGIVLAGEPMKGLGSQILDYGVSPATDDQGNSLGMFHSYEQIRSFGIGGNVLEVAQGVGHLAGSRLFDTAVRYGDVSAGWVAKRVEVFLAPGDQPGEVTTYDSGILARVTPYNSIDYPGFLGGLDRIAAIRVDVSHGRSTQNYNEAEVAFIDEDQAHPVARISRRGWATRIAIDIPRSEREKLRSGNLGWLVDLTGPLLQWGKAWDRLLLSVHDANTGTRSDDGRIYDAGWELTIAGIFSIRRGRVDDPEGTVLGSTSGWGLKVSYDDVAGVQYDHATVPQSMYLDDLDREGFTMYVVPQELWKRLHR